MAVELTLEQLRRERDKFKMALLRILEDPNCTDLEYARHLADSALKEEL